MSHNIKTAQFGGVGGGGQVSPYSPGRSPIGRGGSNPGGHEINISWDDTQNFDMLLRRTHQDIDTSDRNIETRLTPQHKYFEETKVYVLTPEERMREKLRRDLHNFKNSLEEQAKKIKEKDTPIVPKEEHMVGFDVTLGKRRQFDDKQKRKFDYEDKVPDQIKPSRIHYSNNLNERTAIIKRRDRITEEEDADVEERNIFDVVPFTNPPIGRTPVLFHGDELEEYFSKLRQEAAPNDEGQRENANTDTIFTKADPEYNPNVHPRNEISNEPADDGLLDMDLFVSLEGNLHPKKSPSSYFDRNNLDINTKKEPMGLEDAYPGMTFLGIHSPASFQY